MLGFKRLSPILVGQGQQYNIEEELTVIYCTPIHFNGPVGTPKQRQKHTTY